MDDGTRWIELDGAVNARDLGGLPTADGRSTRWGRVLRSDNLQDLSVTDIRILLDDYALKNVIDLRSDAEVRLEGPGPLTRIPTVTVHQLSLFPEAGRHTDVAADTDLDTDVDVDKALPWQDDRSTGHYLGYLTDRGDSIVAALRVMTRTDGSSLVHCAAGKDRTGVVCALALDVAGVTREAIVADYVQTGERLEAILRRLRASDTYAADLDSRPADTHKPHAALMEKLLARVDEEFGGTLGWLAGHGWTPEDTDALRDRLLTP
ncbi:tyrosine-protein phosphatase [Actinomadura bangladeshensis]|jgi:protein tyrosine/serine phosphatase|uniref:Tyrosine-protein phosphatase n=1 Tax=Actinomadura bangladeshensis TaxID=453573 RepID=A0A6L9QPT0_9ACTN|nr:tyrosine-protein phosphatase [Actinomadura bangladeshensis]NEA26683.1 tyrosine-protein phosphatase [Actinomadura bangladeshensis]